MKKHIYLKIATVIFAVIMITALGIGASAATDSAEELRIAYCNLSFENDTHLMYAISSDDENVKLLVWLEPKDVYEAGTEVASLDPLPEQMDINGKPYTVFKYTGLAAKQMTDDVYVRAYIDNGDGDAEYGAVHKYSILQYAYNKLGKTGTATTNEKLIKHLENMLAYGASAQELYSYKTDRLATDDFIQVMLSDGTLPDGFKSGLYLSGEEVKISAPMQNGEGVEFSHWEDKDGNVIGSVGSGYTLTVGAENAVFTPNYINCSKGLTLTSHGDGTCYVAGIGNCTDTDLVIPYVSQSGDVVTGIGDKAFLAKSVIQNVTIHKSIITIGSSAFASCQNLKTVLIANGVESIKNYAFRNCSVLESIIIPDSVISIGEYVFDDCNSLSSVTIGDGITRIVDYAFEGCKELASVVLGNNVVSIGNYAFKDCIKLMNIAIPDSVTTIGNQAFYGCKNLAVVTLGEKTTNIGGQSFQGCTNLTSIVIPNSVVRIGNQTFVGCSKLQNITFKDTSIWYRTANYTDWTNLTNGTIIDVTVDVDNVRYFNDTYYASYWYKL